MIVSVNSTPVVGPWGGGNQFTKAFYDYLPNENTSVFNIGNCQRQEVEFLVDVSPETLYQQFKSHVHGFDLIARINENDARKNTSHVDKFLVQYSREFSGTIFVSEWLKTYFLNKGWKCENNTVIINGVDNEIFKPNKKFDNGKINIVAHHWSNNEMKGFDIYDKIDQFVGKNDKYSFTYIGRERGTFKHTKVIPPIYGKELGDELGKYDVYVSASRFDPGPNHVIESISCKIPTYVYLFGGGGVEFAGNSHVYNSWEDLENILLSGKFELNSTEFDSWKDCIEKYRKFMYEVTV